MSTILCASSNDEQANVAQGADKLIHDCRLQRICDGFETCPNPAILATNYMIVIDLLTTGAQLSIGRRQLAPFAVDFLGG
ncbi:hypothetical protein A5742_15540 [Mycolicibacterium fortuitum]|uniref:Uncharacterized protein n=1 Tax=Mycolicibacterium fortuitum TaxID=1766 RepID=A0ABD6QCQ3_MYCFO|nr:hypothetical protein A5742_15540 [Mycolicibacterium fortuitum]